jgi:uncharacterized protein YgiM (DUF1202 family)
MSRQIATVVGLACALVGCSGKSAPAPIQATEAAPRGATEKPGESYTHVIAAEVEYYTSGPQQGRPPDGKFKAGTKVNVIQEAGSYTQVRSEDGIEAFVASDAIKEIDP